MLMLSLILLPAPNGQTHITIDHCLPVQLQPHTTIVMQTTPKNVPWKEGLYLASICD